MSLLDETGAESDGLQALIRVYPTAVAGDIVEFSYHAESRVAELLMTSDGPGLSEFSVPSRLYPEGVDVTLEGVEGCHQFDEAVGRLYVSLWEAGEATVLIQPSQSSSR